MAARDIFVDSSAWIAFFSASDGHHTAAHGAFTRVLRERRPLFTSTLVVAEVHRLILYRTNVRMARAVLTRMSSDEVRIEHTSASVHSDALAFLDRLADQPITYADAVSFAVMRAARCTTALTFDRHFVMAGFRTWPAR